MKRILTIQDLSCIGKCSLTAALPIISAAGIETCIVPTALLSAHTQFEGFTFCDLSEQMEAIKAHWNTQGMHFDAIYTGYLGTPGLVDTVLDYVKCFKEKNTKLIVDPAMADGGKLYAGLEDGLENKMAKLCEGADIVLPNISEACLMCGLDYPGEDAGEETVKAILKKVAQLGAKCSVITGVEFSDGTLGFMGLDGYGDFFRYGTEKVNMKSHGTGDVFSSSFTGAYVRGLSEKQSLRIAADYTCACIKNSYEDPQRVSYAVNFEAELPLYMKLLGII